MTATALMAAAAAFNLVCTGTGFKTLGQKTTDTKFTIVYRVDLESTLYCSDKCANTHAIYEISTNEIILNRFEESGWMIEVSVNRESGFYNSFAQSPSGTIWDQGTCERAPFTGFPARRF